MLMDTSVPGDLLDWFGHDLDAAELGQNLNFVEQDPAWEMYYRPGPPIWELEMVDHQNGWTYLVRLERMSPTMWHPSIWHQMR